MRVILISGKAEHGKTTAARQLRLMLEDRGYKVAKLAYGDYVKHTVRGLFDWDGQKDVEGRALLQSWGSVIRGQDADFWTRTVIDLAGQLEPHFDYVIVDDARYINEIELWPRDKYRITTLRVNRQGHASKLTETQQIHPSETELDGYHFDLVIEHRMAAELTDKIKREVLPKVIPNRIDGRQLSERAATQAAATRLAQALLSGKTLSCITCTSPGKTASGCDGACQHANGLPRTVPEVIQAAKSDAFDPALPYLAKLPEMVRQAREGCGL